MDVNIYPNRKQPKHWWPMVVINPDSKVHVANMGPVWGRQDPGGPHVGPMNFVIGVNSFSVGDKIRKRNANYTQFDHV